MPAAFGRNPKRNAASLRSRMHALRRKHNAALGVLGGIDARNSAMAERLRECQQVLLQMVAVQEASRSEILADLDALPKNVTPAALARLQRKVQEATTATAQLQEQMSRVQETLGDDAKRHADLAEEARKASRVVTTVHEESLKEIDDVASSVTHAHEEIRKYGPICPDTPSADPNRLIGTSLIRVSGPSQGLNSDVRTLFGKRRGTSRRYNQPGVAASRARAQEGVNVVKPLDN